MTRPYSIHAVLLSLLVTAATQPVLARDDTPADLVFRHGGVYTVNTEQPWAEAVAVTGNQISYVGSDSGVAAYVGPETQVIDLQGHMLLPGFGDSHVHLLVGGQDIAQCDLSEADTPDRISTTLKSCETGQALGPGDWLRGTIWARSAFPGSTPPKGFLDELFPSRPVAVATSDGHSLWVNKKALELAHIDASTPDPAHGVIERDSADGSPTGILDEAAIDLVTDIIPPPTQAMRMDYLRTAIRLANQFGITSAIDPGLDLDDAQVYTTLDDRNELSIRMLLGMTPLGLKVTGVGPDVYDLVQQRHRVEGPHLQADSVKIFIDGVIEAGTSPLFGGYSGRYANNDVQPNYTADELNELFTRLDAMGISIHVHAIGDVGIRRTLDAFQAMRAANGASDNRHVMAHLQLISEQDRCRFAKLGITASFQLLWAYPDDYTLKTYPPIIGQERIEQQYPAASLLKCGTRIAGGSDWTVTSMNPLLAIETGITRQDPITNTGPVLNADESLDLKTMLEAYTKNTAWAMKLDKQNGTIETGKLADLVVLDRNLFRIPAHEISDAGVLMTVFDGRVVYRRSAPNLPGGHPGD